MLDLTKMAKISGWDRRPRSRYYVGAVFVAAGTEHTRRYETAAWWTKLVTTEDRWYPVFASRNHIHSEQWGLSALVEAVVEAEHTPSMFGGVAYGSEPQGTNHRHVGSPSSFTLQVTPAMADTGQYMPVTLGFSVIKNFYVHDWASIGNPGAVHVSSSTGWRPYSDTVLVKMTAAAGLALEQYGRVVLAETADAGS